MTQNKQSLKDKIKQELNASKQFAEELNLQLNLGTAEASDEFEKQKVKLRSWLQDADKKLDEAKEISNERAVELKGLIEAVRVQAALGKAEAGEKWNEQQVKLNIAIQQLKKELLKVQDSLGKFAEDADEKLEKFHTRFDLFRLQLNLGKADTRELWEHKKEEIAKRLHELKQNLQKEEKEASEKWDVFSSEMGDAWNHIKKAFKV